MNRLARALAAVITAAFIALPPPGLAQQTAPSPSPAGPTPGPGALSVPFADPYPSTYTPYPSRPTLIRNATLLTAAGPAIHNGSILLQDGKIAAVGADVAAPAGAVVIDGRGKFVTPGIVDVHSHMGDYPAPAMQAHSDGNEATNPNTANVWAEHSVWPQDPQFPRALAGGVTTVQILPGSANLIGGRSAILKVVPARTVQDMKFPGARYGLKMACGENPKRVYQNRGPSTRMGNMAGYRAAWIAAEAYKRKWDAWNATHKGDPPQRDLTLETLAEALRGDIYVHMHCYRADEMAQVIDMSHEFGYKVRDFHHAIEAYKIADLLAKEGIAATMWADWGGFKMESLDSVRANIGLVDAAGARATIHSDDPQGIQHLNQEVAKAMFAARRVGLNVTEDTAVKWMTINPAYALGLDDKIGSLEAGKNADVVLWDGDPFSVYSHAEKVFVDGAQLYDRDDPAQTWRTDFELGYVKAAVRK
ncbi:MAG: amidohydrolase family protein [Candidatus Eremiobacteraeota bacterium]|nr:amidohydrolase family protein [Candidatus Eremiobacteraeota bacterium]